MHCFRLIQCCIFIINFLCIAVIGKSTYSQTGAEVEVALPDGRIFNLHTLSSIGALYTNIAQTTPKTLGLTLRSPPGMPSVQISLQSSPLILPKQLKVYYYDKEHEGEAKTALMDTETTACHSFNGDGKSTSIQTQINICNDELDAEIRVDGQVWVLKSVLDNGQLSFAMKKREAVKPGKCGNAKTASYNSELGRMRRDIDLKMQKRMHAPSRSNETTRYIELYVVVDNALFLRSGSDLAKTTTRALKIINYASKLYSQMNIYLAVVGLEIWSDADKIVVTGQVSDVLSRFVNYRRFVINKVTNNDNAQLFVEDNFADGTVGQGALSVCSHVGSAAVVADHYPDDWIQAATTMAHELGHNLGLKHDDEIDPSCMCPRTDVDDDKCIMYSMSDADQPIEWSTCSVDAVWEKFLVEHTDICLKNLPLLDRLPESCGNYFIDEGEECDCGPLEECETPCCDAKTCRFTDGSLCASGSCCDSDTCQLKPATTVCRKPQDNDCDLPEFCTGESEWCPLDTYKYEGFPFGAGGSPAGYCYHGKNKNRDDQCRMIWGDDVTSSYDGCYTKWNIKGKYYGNCGYTITETEGQSSPTLTYRECAPENSQCGLLHCNTSLATGAVGVRTYADYYGFDHPDKAGERCAFVSFDVGNGTVDPGLVTDGAKCGENKWCKSYECVSTPEIPNADICECNENGVCNQYGRCHCNDGYDPVSNCLEEGAGGSIDSGPAAIYFSPTPATTTTTPSDIPKENNWLTPLIISLVVLALVVAVVVVLVIKRRQIRELVAKGRAPKRANNNSDGDSVDKLHTSKLSTTSTIPPLKDRGPISTPILESSTNNNIVLQDLPANLPQDNPTYFSQAEINGHFKSSPTPLRVADLCQGSNNSTLNRNYDGSINNGSVSAAGIEGSDSSSCPYEEPLAAGMSQSPPQQSNVYSDIEDAEEETAALIRDSSPENEYEVPVMIKHIPDGSDDEDQVVEV